MKRRITFFSGILILLASIVLLQLETTAQRTRKARDKKKAISIKIKKKLKYKNYVWIEGENASSTNFAKEKTYNFFCSNKFALQLSREADPSKGRGYYATYNFYIPRSKKYDLWFASTPPGSKFANKTGYASPVDWKIDDGIYRTASSENTYVKKIYGAGGFYWVKISGGFLSAGRHTITLRVKQKRSSGWDYFFYLDAMLFVPAYSGYLNRLMKFPDIAPENFNTESGGIEFEKAAFYRRRLKIKPYERKSIIKLAQIYTWLFEHDKAVALYRRLLERNKRDTWIRILAANNIAWAGRLDEAISEYKKVIAVDRNNINARKLLAVLAGWNNRYDEAIKNYREIIAIAPQNVDAYISLATMYTWKSEANKALEIFERAERIDPDNIKVLYALGDNYSWGGKTYKAIKHFKRIIRIDEKEIEAYKKLARIYIQEDQDGKAAEIMEDAGRVVLLNPELSAFSLDVKGEAEREKRKTLEGYKKVLMKNPEDLGVRKNLAEAYIWNGMNREAVQEYDSILNYKLFRAVENTEIKLKTIILEIIKFRAAEQSIRAIGSSFRPTNDYYTGIIEKLRKDKRLPEDMSSGRLKSDSIKILYLMKKNDLLEYNLSRFLDIIALYSRDTKSYEAQRAALKWKFDSGSAISQTERTKKSNPNDYRPSKLLGILHCWFGSRSKSIDELKGVYRITPVKVNIAYPAALVEASNYDEAMGILSQLEKKNLLRGMKKSELKSMKIFWLKMKSREGGNINLPGDGFKAAVKVSDLAVKEYRRYLELKEEWEKHLNTAGTTVRKVFKKAFLDLENENVGIYNDIANYYLNNDQMLDALSQYYNILKVQPLNVDIHYKLGNLNQALGYWRSAMKNYEICINNQPAHNMARKSHYELQKLYSPVLISETEILSDNNVSRMKEDLFTIYPVSDWLTMKAGYGFMKIDDEISQGAVSKTGESYFPSKGSVMQHSAFAGAEFRIVPFSTKLFIEGRGNIYSGSVEFDDTELNGHTISRSDADINYSTMNYSVGVAFSMPGSGISLKAEYRKEDFVDLTQSLRLEYDYTDKDDSSNNKSVSRDEITSDTVKAEIDISFSALDIPFLDRIFLYDSVTYRSLSDSNTRLSSYNQLTYRILRLPTYGIILDLAGIFTHESSKFAEYNDPDDINNLPYWAPESINSYGGGITWSHEIPNLLEGSFKYSISFIYSRDNEEHVSMNPGIKLGFNWDHIELYGSYNYSRSISPKTADNPEPEPYISHYARLGIKGKFFGVYSTRGLVGRPIILITANPNLITSDGDGKDDFTTFSLTGFDKKGIFSWELEIFDKKGNKVKNFGRKGAPPATIRWDGTDKAGNVFAQGSYKYRLVIVNSAKERSVSHSGSLYLTRKKRAITLKSSYKGFSPNGDGVKDKIGISFKATEKGSVDVWHLNIRNALKRTVRRMSGYEFIPYDIHWDGTDNNGNVLADGNYTMFVTVKYSDREMITSPEIKIKILTRALIEVRLNRDTIVPQKDSVRIRAIASSKEVSQWKIYIRAADKTVVRVMQGSGVIPEQIEWDGTDEAKKIIGYNLPLKIQMEIVDSAGNRAKSNEADLFSGFLVKSKKGKRVVYIFNQDLVHRGKSDSFTPGGLRVLKELVKVLKRYGSGRGMNIFSHTSSDGSGSKNKILSLRRAKKLKDLLENKGNISGIKYSAMGEDSPYEDGKEGRWDSRYEIVMD